MTSNISQHWLLLLSYDGTNYHGWQIQPRHNTIEAELEKAIYRLTGEVVKVFGAGRTDAGVHALNQTASFASQSPFTQHKWRQALNSVLPSDIVVKCILSVPATFHARHSALGKRYRYLINNKPYPSPFATVRSWWIRQPLDVDAMMKAASFLIGEHDFSAFRASQCSSPSPVKQLRKITITPNHNNYASLCIDVEANSFLQHMVRIIVGTLVEVGLHKIRPNDIPAILENRDRKKSGKTAPPHGLYVLQVLYHQDEVQWPEGVVDL